MASSVRNIKLIVLGNSGVGKTSLLLRYIKHEFQTKYKPTVGADFLTKELFLGKNRHVVVQLWDTAGQERFQGLNSVFFRGADGCVLVYDVTDEASFADLHSWWQAFRQHNTPDQSSEFPFLLIGNKLDRVSSLETRSEDKSMEGLEQETKRKSPGIHKMITKRTAVVWANEHQCIAFYETSAKDGANVDVAINELCRFILHKREEEALKTKPVKYSNDSVILDEISKSKVTLKKDEDCCG